MRRLLTLTALLMAVAGGVVEAQVTPGDGVILVNMGSATGKIAGTEESVDGGTISFSYEKLSSTKPISFLFAIGYQRFEDELKEDSADSVLVHRQVSTLPLYIGGRAWLGKGKVQGFAGLALGLAFAELETTFNDNSQTSVSTSGFGLGVPLGGAISLGDKFLIDVNYTLNWLWSSEAFEDDLVHSFSAGLGLRLGK